MEWPWWRGEGCGGEANAEEARPIRPNGKWFIDSGNLVDLPLNFPPKFFQRPLADDGMDLLGWLD